MNTNTLMMAIAGVAGLVAAVLGFFFLQQAGGQTAAPEQVRVPQVQVLAAARDLPYQVVIDSERDLQLISVPQDSYPGRYAMKEDDRAELDGRQLGETKAAGQPILYADLRSIRELDFPRDMRAVTMEVDSETAHAGLLVPGDYIDLVVSRQIIEEIPTPSATRQPTLDPNASPEAAISQILSQAMAQGMQTTLPNAEWESELLLENVRVLAVNNDVARTRRQIAALLVLPDDQQVEMDPPRTITLELSPEQALRFEEVRAAGLRLSVLMRSPTESRERSTNLGPRG